MPTETPVLTLQKMRRYGDEGREFYLSKGPVLDGEQPRVRVTRWDIDAYFRAAEKNVDAGKVIQPPTLYQLFKAAEDPEARVLESPSEWTSHIILNPNAPTDTRKSDKNKYVLGNEDGRTLQPSDKPRIINPTQRYQDGDIQVVHGTIHDLPFQLVDGYHNGLEDLDPVTGFFNFTDRPREQGKYGVWFGSEPRLYAAILDWDGGVACRWGPSYSDDGVGLRGASTGNLPPELLESEVDVLQAQLERAGVERAEERQALLKRVEGLETHYRSGLEQVEQIKAELQE